MSFNNFNLQDDIKDAIDKLGFKKPTEVQEQVIPMLLDSKDIIVKSQTGTGKTASFAIPICEKVDWEENKPQTLVLTPTRELALQVKEDFFNIGRMKRIKVVSLFGKTGMKSQIRDLKQKTHVVVGTPGRVFDHLERGTLDVSEVKYLVIDEADEMLNMGFIRQIEDVVDRLPQNRVTALLSATMPEQIERLAKEYLIEPEIINVKSDSSTIDRITQEKIFVRYEDKMDLLRDITTVENPDSCIIFCNTKQRVDEVDEYLYKLKYTVDRIHGGMEQSDRTDIMREFKLGDFRYLVATDVAARGIDVDNISLVINFDVTQEKENYIHRIGRTGRKDNSGKAISLVAPNEERFIDDIEELTEKALERRDWPSKREVELSIDAFETKLATKPEKKEQKGANVSKEILHLNSLDSLDNIIKGLVKVDSLTK